MSQTIWPPQSVHMTPLRRKRLLLLASKGGDHKRWYQGYLVLIGEGLVTWTLGTAFLTHKGRKALEEE
jgi:hypothetical protein